jgi:hypothetical protein
MAHYALLNEYNIVVNVIGGPDEGGDTDWEQHYSEITGLVCKRTSCNTCAGEHSEGKEPFRKNYASVGYAYDEDRDAFIPPKEYESWVLNEETCRWDPPIPRPDGHYVWEEESQSWLGPFEIITEMPLDGLP